MIGKLCEGRQVGAGDVGEGQVVGEEDENLGPGVERPGEEEKEKKPPPTPIMGEPEALTPAQAPTLSPSSLVPRWGEG